MKTQQTAQEYANEIEQKVQRVLSIWNRLRLRLANGTNEQIADLANYLGIDKPKAIAAKTGPEWTAADFERSTVAHGKELPQSRYEVA